MFGSCLCICVITLQDVAERVAREARVLLFAPSIMPMDAYPMQHLPEERFVLLITATTGQVSNQPFNLQPIKQTEDHQGSSCGSRGAKAAADGVISPAPMATRHT